MTKIFKSICCIFTCMMVLIGLFLLSNSRSARALSDTISLNEIKTVYLSGLDVRTFYFTPSTDQYYVVETTGSKDTVMRISNLSVGSIVNDDGGIENNSRIYFKGESARQIKIEVKFVEDYSSFETQSGYINLQVRKQRFSMIGYTSNFSTLPDLEVPYNSFGNLYSCAQYKNKYGMDIVHGDDSRNLKVINSEILFLSGHGDVNGFGFYTYGKKNFEFTTLEPNVSMDRVRIVVWSSCESAGKKPTFTDKPIAEHSVFEWGAKSALGFRKSTNYISNRKFTDAFFESLAKGATVNESAVAGKKKLGLFDAAKDYVVYGNGNIRATDITPNDVTFSLKPISDEDIAKINSELSSGYTEEYLGENEYRYYELINGYESNNVIDVKRENGKIVSYDDLRNEYDTVLEINEDYLCTGLEEHVSSYDGDYRLLQEQEEHIVYCNFDGVMTPVKLSFSTYVNDEGYTILETDCINLFNGQKLNYSEISGF